jgi:hypothetical protein
MTDRKRLTPAGALAVAIQEVRQTRPDEELSDAAFGLYADDMSGAWFRLSFTRRADSNTEPEPSFQTEQDRIMKLVRVFEQEFEIKQKLVH